MKVICIDGVKTGTANCTNNYYCKPEDQIFEGEIYAVLRDGHTLKPSYVLSERNERVTYCKHRFIPLSKVNELKLANHLIDEL